MSRGEHDRIARLRAIFDPAPKGVIGIGDDAAVLPHPEGELVWSIDASVDGVHFRRDWVDWPDVGYRATMAALSDLAAMGARPVGVLSALTLPPALQDEELEAIAYGQREACDEAGTALIGGNLSGGSLLSITTTVLGAAKEVKPRAGAQPGDKLWVAGMLGWAGAGRHALESDRRENADAFIACWRRPRALLDAGTNANASAMLDVSDGLAADAWHMAKASNASLVLLTSQLIDASLIAWFRSIGDADPTGSALRAVLSGGEDYALLASAPMSPGPSFRTIGYVTDGPPSVELEDASGQRSAPVAPGFDHFTK